MNKGFSEEIRREVWKDIPNYEELYQVSNLGRVRSKTILSTVIYKNGKIQRRNKQGRILKLLKGNRRYYTVMLSKEGNTKRFLVHRLVLMTFKGLPKNNMVACHGKMEV